MMIFSDESLKNGVKGGFSGMSYFWVKTVNLGHFWVEKRDFESFLGQNMSF